MRGERLFENFVGAKAEEFVDSIIGGRGSCLRESETKIGSGSIFNDDISVKRKRGFCTGGIDACRRGGRWWKSVLKHKKNLRFV